MTSRRASNPPKTGTKARVQPGHVIAYLIFFVFLVLFLLSIVVGSLVAATTSLGGALAGLSAIFFEGEDFVESKFVVFHAMFIVGMFLVLVGINAGLPFNAVDSFEMGSFALVVTTFLFTAGERFGASRYSVLFHSATGTLLFFSAGALLAFNEVFSTAPSPAGQNLWVNHALAAFFLMGAIDLLIVALQFYMALYRQYKASQT